MNRPVWRQPVQIADAVSATLQRLGLAGQVRQHELWCVWPQAVGPEIAQHAQPHSFWHGRLVVHVTDSVWLYQLQMMRHRLVAALNERLKPAEIREIVFRVGEVAAPPIGQSTHPPRSESTGGVDPLRVAEIDRTLASLGDVPFRDALRQLWLRAVQDSTAGPSLPRRRQSR